MFGEELLDSELARSLILVPSSGVDVSDPSLREEKEGRRGRAEREGGREGGKER